MADIVRRSRLRWFGYLKRNGRSFKWHGQSAGGLGQEQKDMGECLNVVDKICTL